jgi:hypothetical protein
MGTSLLPFHVRRDPAQGRADSVTSIGLGFAVTLKDVICVLGTHIGAPDLAGVRT